MSGAQHGYVNPSSTDKCAADENDGVDLQLLTGEGVTLSVPPPCLGMICASWCPSNIFCAVIYFK